MPSLRTVVALFALISSLCACTVPSGPTPTGALPHVAKPMDNGQTGPPGHP
jgi:hypothetical protein